MMLMQALAIGFKLEASATDLRLNHYPAIHIQDLRDGAVSRISLQTDFDNISLLLQDRVGGLEIEECAHPGFFVPVEPRPMG